MNSKEAEQESQRVTATGTGLPGVRTWQAVYLAVLGVFVAWVAFLTVLPRLFP